MRKLNRLQNFGRLIIVDQNLLKCLKTTPKHSQESKGLLPKTTASETQKNEEKVLIISVCPLSGF